MKYLRRLTRNERTLLKKYKLSIENSLCRKGMSCYEYKEYDTLLFNHNPFQVFLIWNNDISCLHTFNLLTEEMDRYTFINYFEKYYESYTTREYRITQILQFNYNKIFINDITWYIIQKLISLGFDN
jgi:hypothetical protein